MENHKFKDVDADDDAPVGPVAFLSGGGMLYAGWGAPGGLWYMRRAGSTLSYELHGPVGPAVPVAIPESP